MHDDHLRNTFFSENELERRLRQSFISNTELLSGGNGQKRTIPRIGFLSWKERDEQEGARPQSQLLLLPVRIEKERGIGASVYRLPSRSAALDRTLPCLRSAA